MKPGHIAHQTTLTAAQADWPAAQTFYVDHLATLAAQRGKEERKRQAM